MESLKLKRHETFVIRDGWLEKGINIVRSDSESFRKKDSTRIFGIGTNMVKSLRFWLDACNIASFNFNGASLTEFGDVLYCYDPFLENSFSWWFVHLFLSTDFEKNSVINAYFNSRTFDNIEKERCVEELKTIFKSKNCVWGADSSIESDVSILFRTYYSMDKTNPEENMDCPLSELGLIKSEGKNKYSKVQPKLRNLDYRVVYYSLINVLGEGVDSCNIEDLCFANNNPCNILNLSKSAFFMYLDEMKLNGLIDVVKTAGLNTIYIKKRLSLKQLFESYFKQSRR